MSTQTAAAPQFMGVRVKRREDPNLITGQGKYVGDFQPDNLAYMMILRSPYAHAVINSIDTSEAGAMDGVIGVYTADDINDQVSAPLPMVIPTGSAPYSDAQDLPRYPLASGKVRHVGDPVAVVVAESKYQAADAMEAIYVDYDPLDAVVDPEKALEEGAPILHDEAGTNVAFRWNAVNGDIDDIFANAEHVTEVRIHNQRLIPSAMEPRAVLADYNADDDNLTIWTSTQIPHSIRDEGAPVLGVEADQIRAIAPEVGGGFGAKSNIFQEEILVPLLSRKLQRPVKWVATRSEDFVATSHGRDQINIVKLASDKEGKVTGVDLKLIADCGAYYSRVTPGIPPLTAMMMTGVYDIPNARCSVDAVLTNKGMNEPYRGAGRPEAAFFIERAMDALADDLGMDPVDVRRKNFVAPDAFPYTTPMGAEYDSGEYDRAMTKALDIIGYEDARKAQAEQRANSNGKLMGVGFATYVEICGFGPWEAGGVFIDDEGKATVLSGSSPHGQGHQTAWAQIAAEALQMPMEDITVKHGDTAVVPRGVGTFGSRSAPVGGSAVMTNATSVREKAKAIAAHMLEAAVEDVVVENGSFHVAGSPSVALTWRDVAQKHSTNNLPEDLKGDLSADVDFATNLFCYPFGAHAAIVEVDAATGEIEIKRYVSVDDCGVVINPLLVEGQVHGGIAQGIGQALLENAAYDETGNLVSGSLMDYTLPRADNFPVFETNRTVTPTPINPLGVKGIGEAATIGSTPTIVNAVIDALSHLGVRQLDMPLTAEKVWQAIQDA
ncbi:MAG: xanthine dehydrogenase family protein molybdopterin-binding subunit [Chloroflexota bacterium]